jgi:hypothetical protein
VRHVGHEQLDSATGFCGCGYAAMVVTCS